MSDDSENSTTQIEGPNRNWQEVVAWIVGAIIVFALVVVIWIYVGRIPSERFPRGSDRSFVAAATYGDSFGYVNALFSALAFAGIIIAIALQGRELGLQRQELRLQRAELKITNKQVTRSADAQQETEKVLALTAYLNTLNVLREGHSAEAVREGGGLEYSLTVHSELIAELDELVDCQRDRIHSLFSVRSKADRIARKVSKVAQILGRRWDIYKEDFAKTVANQNGWEIDYGVVPTANVITRAKETLQSFVEELDRCRRVLDSEDDFSLDNTLAAVIDEFQELIELDTSPARLPALLSRGCGVYDRL